MRDAKHVCRYTTLVTWVAAAVLLAGCSTPSWLCWFPSGVKKVTLVTAPDTNGDRAIAVDLVFATQDLAAQEIGKLNARDYFSRRAQLVRDFPQTVQVRSWELAPGQLIDMADANPPCNIVQSYLFADFASPGDHRAALTSASAVQVTLGADDMMVKQ